MKRCAIFAVPAVVVGMVLLPAGAGASPSPLAPVAPAVSMVELATPAPVPTPAPTAVVLPAAPVIAEVPVAVAVPSAPALASAAAETLAAVHDAEMHAMLCAARPVFCEVDQSGRYIVP